MNVNKSDASTSTDDIKGRPLCLFYFTHPFGVVSPDPPTVTTAPPHIARAFLNMEPVSPFTFCTSSTEDLYNSTGSSRPSYDLGKPTIYEDPVNLGGINMSQCTGETGPRRDCLSSSLFSSEIWFESSSSCRSDERTRRLIPYNKFLPPLRLPQTLLCFDNSEDAWPKKSLHPGKFSLPPIELPALALDSGKEQVNAVKVPSDADVCENRTGRLRRRMGVLKHRRRAFSDVRRMVTCLLKRAVRGECDGGGVRGAGSPALRRLLRTVRDAWPEPRSLFDSHSQSKRSSDRPRPLIEYKGNSAGALLQDEECEPCNDIMMSHSLGDDAPPRPDASPGLLRRRYSVPETIMRKYRVAQQRTECDESWSTSRGSTGSASRRAAPRFLRDREIMRKSALLRRLWGRAPPCCHCCRDQLAARHSRSLDGSHSELRSRRTPAEYSASTFRSHARADDEPWQSEPRVPSLSDEITSANADTGLVYTHKDLPNSFYDDLSTSVKPVARTEPEECDSRRPTDYQTDMGKASEDQLPLGSKTSASYEMLEIVVTDSSEARVRSGRVFPKLDQELSNINIDEYVSSVLVESLNSLTDRLELVTSRVPGDGKVSVIEKEIKVKLQSTGVNTIVHLSPTSNNQIIFGNEELCDGSEKSRIDFLGTPCIRDEPPGAEFDEARASAELSSGVDAGETHSRDEDVNKAVFRQIQKLFREEVHEVNPESTEPTKDNPSISHIEISEVSNVGFFFDDSTKLRCPRVAVECDPLGLISHSDPEILSGVGTGNYFETVQIGAVVPRFTALPHTASMEVNTSSETELVGSDCTSLVDSLDDPNSPRSVLLRQTFTGRRTELVRSAIDVLDLLPEDVVVDSEKIQTKASEYFYIGIKNNECSREKENVNVADRMPENIKQRLYRRHRRRQQRMESARRGKVKEQRWEFQKPRLDDIDRMRDVERDCAAIIEALIHDVILKIAQDEYKYVRIKHRSEPTAVARSDENSLKRNRRKPSHTSVSTATSSITRRASIGSVGQDSTKDKSADHNEQQLSEIRGKLSLMTRPALATDNRRPRRVYQKSEIREGNKCIEVLEILEYVNGDRSSPDTPGNDDCQSSSTRTSKKSRIPIPVYEKTHRELRSSVKSILNIDSISKAAPCNYNPEATHSQQNSEQPATFPICRVSLPSKIEQRPRSGSVRFRRVFDVIPEERSSFSVDSSTEDVGRGSCSVAPGITFTSAPTTRSVATSPHAEMTNGPMHLKVYEGNGKKARDWPVQREEGIIRTCVQPLLHQRTACSVSVE